MNKKLAALLIAVAALTGCIGPMVTTEPPTVRYVAAYNAPGIYGVEFAVGIDGGEKPISYRWTIDGGTMYGQEPTYQYSTNGEYDVIVMATDALGRSAVGVVVVRVYPNEVVCYWNAQGSSQFPGGCWECTFEGWEMPL